MFRFMIQWLLGTILCMILLRAVPGFDVGNLYVAILVAVAIGLGNSLLGLALAQMNFPLAVVLFAAFAFASDVALIVICSTYVDGFYVYSLDPAYWASGALTALIIILRFTMKPE